MMVGPDRGFKLIFEMLRRKPDSVLIWYEDLRARNILPESYWTILSWQLSVWQDPESTDDRPYSQREGYSALAWKYGGFSDVHIRARLAFPQNSSGRAGVFLGDIFCCLNYYTQRVEILSGRFPSWKLFYDLFKNSRQRHPHKPEYVHHRDARARQYGKSIFRHELSPALYSGYQQ